MSTSTLFPKRVTTDRLGNVYIGATRVGRVRKSPTYATKWVCETTDGVIRSEGPRRKDAIAALVAFVESPFKGQQ